MPTSTEDADALFGLPPPPPPPPAPAAPKPVSGGGFGDLAVTSADNRRDLRVKVSWPGRVQLPNGHVVNLKVRDISEGGVGLVTEVHIPAYTVLNFAMGVPSMNEGGGPVTPVSGTIKTTYMVVQGPDIYCGGTWVQVSSGDRELVGKWIRRLKR